MLYIGFVSAAFNSACLAHTGAPCAAMYQPGDAYIGWLRGPIKLKFQSSVRRKREIERGGLPGEKGRKTQKTWKSGVVMFFAFAFLCVWR